MVKNLGPREFLERRAGGVSSVLLDVREDWEIALAPVPGDTVHIRLASKFTFRSHLTGHTRHFRGERTKLIHHGIDGILKL